MKPAKLVITLAAAVFLATPLSAETPKSSAALLKPFVDKHELAGAVALVANGNKVLSVETVGFADIAAGKPMKADSVFWIASQSKGITAAAVMMLVDEGKISLDDPIEKHLPEFRGQMVVAGKDGDKVKLKKPSHPITIREVLSHVSGLPFRSAVEQPTLDALPLADAVKSYAKTPLQTEPGTHYQYSNAGINTAARIIEVVTGKKYEDFMDERLFKPLGMTDTTFWPNENQIARLAKSYRPNAKKDGLVEFPFGQLLYPLNDRNKRFPMPAGGLFSTAKDTALFCQMLLNGGQLNGKRYLSPAAFKELTTRQTPKSIKNSYGLGLSVGTDWFGHGGAHATNMEVRPSKGIVMIWMVQHGGFPGESGKAQGVFKKVKLLSIMAGAFELIGGKPHHEYNVIKDIKSAQLLADEWPTRIVYSGFEIGLAVPYPADSILSDYNYVDHHPLAEAYHLYSPPPHNRPTWDLTSVLHAVRPTSRYFTLSPAGRVTVTDKGLTNFKEDANGRHRFLKADSHQRARVEEALIHLSSQPPLRN